MSELSPEYAAARLLAAQKAIGTGVWVKDLSFDIPIHFDTFTHYSSVCNGVRIPTCEGCTIKAGGVALVLYSGGWNVGRINYTLAHEIGHIILGHDGTKSYEEVYANRFASALTIPFAPLRALGKVGKEQVAEFFGCSVSAASVALERADVFTEFDSDILKLYAHKLDRYRESVNPLDILGDM